MKIILVLLYVFCFTWYGLDYLVKGSETKSSLIPKVVTPSSNISKVKINIPTETITLTPYNHIHLEDVISKKSMYVAAKKLIAISDYLDSSDTIYIIVNSAGGSVQHGLEFIRLMKSVPQKVNTIAIYAFSMGFSILQYGHTRYYVDFATGGQHRRYIENSGKGTYPQGTLDSRVNNVINRAKVQLKYEAGKLGMSYQSFLDKIKEEWWVYGDDFYKYNMVDKKAIIKCTNYNNCPISINKNGLK